MIRASINNPLKTPVATLQAHYRALGMVNDVGGQPRKPVIVTDSAGVERYFDDAASTAGFIGVTTNTVRAAVRRLGYFKDGKVRGYAVRYGVRPTRKGRE